VPEPGKGGLAAALGEQWPSYVAYVVSFATIGIMWVNHHAVLDQVARADRRLLYRNLVLLLFVGLLPWPTNLVATYMREGGDAERIAALVYAGTLVAIGLGFSLTWTYVARRTYLLEPGVQLPPARSRRFVVGAPMYLVAMLAALVSAPLSVAITGAIAVYYALPGGGAMLTGDERDGHARRTAPDA